MNDVSSLIAKVLTIPINVNGASSHTIRAANVGKRWVVLSCTIVASAAGTIEVKSGSTAVTGEIDVSTTVLQLGTGTAVLWAGREVNQALVFTTVGAVDFDGWVDLIEVDPI